MTDSKPVARVIWHKEDDTQNVTTVVKEFRHSIAAAAVARAISFAKISARNMAVGSPELHGQYRVEAGDPPSVHYDSTTDDRILQLMRTHNRSKV